MAINIKFDLVGNPEPPTIILANRNGNKLGQLEIDEKSIELTDRLNDISEISFTVYKYMDDELVTLWDKIVDFKLIYCKEWDMWFEIKVELDEATETIKTVTGTQLGQAELSQIMLYNVEINTEADIERDDYKVSILYDESNPKASILHRILEKAPHYSIEYVAPTLKNIQRSFSFDGTSIYDAYQEIAEEIGCLFVFNSNSDANGKIKRTISVYDLWYGCADCGCRHESAGQFVQDSHILLSDEFDALLIDEKENFLLYRMATECPKCTGNNIIAGYGEDTLIFVTSDELASEGIQLVTDVDSVKNCFKLEAGDDLMTATVRNCNPNGSDYIWRFSDVVKEDMTKELVDKLNSYDETYEYYYNSHISNIDKELLGRYNNLVNKYSGYNEDLQRVNSSIVGYSPLMNTYYNIIDLRLYLQSALMPSAEMSETSAKEQADMLTSSSLSPVAVANIKSVSQATANNAVLSMAKTIVRPTYKVDIKESKLHEDGDMKYWEGNFVVTNYSDEKDTAISGTVIIEVNGDLESFINQKIEKVLNKENTDDLSISGLFEKDIAAFKDELKKYALNPLKSFQNACNACLTILQEEGIGNNSNWSTDDGSDSDLHTNLYMPYYEKLKAIESEMAIRESEIKIIDDLKENVEKCRIDIQNALDFEKYLGNELWLEFCAYRREDKFSNENYISDGLNNAELFERALEFFEVAENEIYKSSELQCSISTSLNNLLAIPKFKKLVDSFKVGSWIRVRVDDKIYKLRLIEYTIDYSNFDNITVEFSDVTKVKDSASVVRSALSQASSMASSYASVQRQASKGKSSNDVITNWIENGLSSTQAKIVDSVDENILLDENGFWCRQYDPITETYSNEQIKIINSTIAITDDNWETTKTAIGKYYYKDPKTGEEKVAYGVNGETIVGKLLVGEFLNISNDSGDLEFGNDGFVVKNDTNTVNINPNNSSIFSIENDVGNIFSLNAKGELVIIGNITASSLTLLDGTSIGTENITGLSDVAISGDYEDLDNTPDLSAVATSGSYNDLSNKPINLSDFTNDGGFITKSVNNLDNYYTEDEVDDLLESKANKTDIEALKEWVLEEIQKALGS